MPIKVKKDLNLQIHLLTYTRHCFQLTGFSDSVHKSSLNQTTLDLRKKEWSFLNRDLPVSVSILVFEYQNKNYNYNCQYIDTW